MGASRRLQVAVTVRDLREEVLGEAAENPAAEGFLARQPAEQAVEQLGAEMAVQAAPLLCGGISRSSGGTTSAVIREAKDRRTPTWCQLSFQGREIVEGLPRATPGRR